MEKAKMKIFKQLFYDNTPSCVLLGFNINDDFVCDQIIRSFDVIFYMMCLIILVTICKRTIKTGLLFIRVTLYVLKLFIRSIKVTHGCSLTKNKKFINEIRFKEWNRKRKNEIRNLLNIHIASCEKCNHNCSKRKILFPFLTLCLSKNKSSKKLNEFDNNIKGLKVIFFNNKFKTKTINPNHQNDEELKHSSMNTSGLDTSGEVLNSLESKTSNQFLEKEMKSNEENKNLETIKNKKLKKIKPKQIMHKKKIFFKQISHINQNIKYPIWFLVKKNQMRIVLRNNESNMKINDSKSKDDMIKSLRKKYHHRKCKHHRKTGNKQSIKNQNKDETENEHKKLEHKQIEEELTVENNSKKNNDDKTENKTSTSITDLVNYFDNKNIDSKENDQQKHFIKNKDKSIKELTQSKIKIISENINKEINNHITNTTILKVNNITDPNLNVISENPDDNNNNNKNNKNKKNNKNNKNNNNNVKDEIMSHIVNISKDTLRTLKFRYNLFKSNKTTKKDQQQQKKRLDVIFEHSPWAL